jgi:hypothetical protein
MSLLRFISLQRRPRRVGQSKMACIQGKLAEVKAALAVQTQTVPYGDTASGERTSAATRS